MAKNTKQRIWSVQRSKCLVVTPTYTSQSEILERNNFEFIVILRSIFKVSAMNASCVSGVLLNTYFLKNMHIIRDTVVKLKSSSSSSQKAIEY